MGHQTHLGMAFNSKELLDGCPQQTRLGWMVVYRAIRLALIVPFRSLWTLPRGFLQHYALPPFSISSLLVFSFDFSSFVFASASLDIHNVLEHRVDDGRSP